MAINLSKEKIIFAYQNIFGSLYPSSLKNNFLGKVRVKICKILLIIFVNFLNLKNFLLRIFYSKKKNIYNLKNIKINLPAIDSKKLLENGWCFIENFCDKQNYELIKENFPDECFFNFKPTTIKYYARGFRSLKKSKPKFIEKFLSLENFYDFLNSEVADELFSEFLNDKNKNYSCYSITGSYLKKNNFLIPHQDGIVNKSNTKMIYNFIYFIDGNNENAEFSGATGIFKDNEFKKPIFVPKNLKNTCLVYNSTDNFFHGFELVEKFGFRKALTFQYFHKEFFRSKEN